MSMAEVNLTVLLAGAPRTGTQSMAIAMHMLGYKVLHTGWHRDARAAWCRYFRSDWGFEDAVRTLEGFDAVLDEPVMHAHEEIMERFPSAKLVLTVRDSAEQWYDRMHAFRVRWAMDCEDCTVCERVLKFVGRSLHSREQRQADAFKEECTRMEWAMFGCDWRTPQTPEVRARCVAGYRRHVENITRATPRERLLVFNVKDGWAPLCDFLGVPRPEAAFPAIDIFREPAVPVMTPCVKLLLAVAVPALFLLLICCCWRHRRRRKLVEKEMRQVRTAIVHQYGGSYNNAAHIDGSRLAKLWSNAFMFTAQNTWHVFEDGTTFVSTGDIGNMWLRDSTVQLLTYVPVAAAEPAGNPLQRVLESAMARQVRFILDDPYSSAFYIKHGPGETGGPNKYECPPAPNCEECICTSCSPPCGNYTYQQDFELDSLLYPLHLHYRYWRATKSTRHLTDELFVALRVILDVLRTEQWHFSKSTYYYQRDPPHHKEGIGLIWSYAVPSDERAGRGYNIPQNIMAVVVLRQAAELAHAAPLGDAALAADLRKLAKEVDGAVQHHGIVRAPGGERVYAFQTDGWGNYTITDDANMPNLLWLPYLGYDDAAGVYRATRRFVLSRHDSNFHSGRYASGLGSPHHSFGLRDRNPGPECNSDCVWHLGLVMQGMTAETFAERARCMRQVLATDAGQNLLHEGFDPNDPKSYNRDGFGWANALFSEWVMRDWVHQTTTPTNVIAATVQV